MAKSSIGQFLAALRKANGMTQQEIADRLHVSNKAVSRWERDECAPDLSLIPALAEIFGVTCDELLKGQSNDPADALRLQNCRLDRHCSGHCGFCVYVRHFLRILPADYWYFGDAAF